jgi:uncharacterized protein YkwD
MTNALLILTGAFFITIGATAQPTQIHSHGDPTPEEQLMLEMINRARANPTEEGIRLMDTDDARVQAASSHFKINATATKAAFAGYPARAPLAFHTDLIAAARAHSQDMDANNFQGHNSSNGDDLSDRYATVGYASQGMYGENVAAYSESVWHGHCGLNVDWGEENQKVLGHRENIMNFKSFVFTEIGIGIVKNDKGLMQNHVGPYVITQDFGTRPVRYITGVVYNDRNNNGFYDIGEGLAGVTVKPNRGTYYAVTSTSGGYAIPYTGNGSVTVVASEGGLAAPISKTVEFSGDNVKVDFTPASQGPGVIALKTPANNATNVAMNVTLTWNATAMADSYEWQIATTQNFSAASIVAEGTATQPTATATMRACATRHYWRVRGINGAGPGSWSSPFSFTTGGRMPASTTSTQPRGQQSADANGGLAFTWTQAADATSYDIRVKSAASPYPIVYADSAINGTSTSVPVSALGAGSFTWEVRSANACGKGGWSTPASFALSVTGVADEAQPGWALTLAPFPVTSASTLMLTAPDAGVVRVTVSDLTGRVHALGSFDVHHGLNVLPIMDRLPQGFSVLTIHRNDSTIARMRVIVP